MHVHRGGRLAAPPVRTSAPAQLVVESAAAPVNRLAMQSAFSRPRISTATYTFLYVVPETTGDGRLRRSSTCIESSCAAPVRRTHTFGDPTNVTSFALAETSRRIAARPVSG